MSYLTLQSKTNAGLVKRKYPTLGEKPRLTKQRQLDVVRHDPVDPFATQTSGDASRRDRDAERLGYDGMAILAIRPDTRSRPARAGTGGFVKVLNGTLGVNGATYGPWSVALVDADERTPEPHAGAGGIEALVTVFPKYYDGLRELGADGDTFQDDV